MKDFKNILVALDNSPMDAELVKAVDFISGIAGTESISFIHIIRNTNFSEKILKEFPNLISNAIAERKNSLQQTIDRNLDTAKGLDVNLEVLEGQPTKALMKAIEVKNADLLVLGRKKEKRNGGVLINRMARRAACSLLVVPEGLKSIKFNKIQVPIDFSSYSHLAMDYAASLIKNGLEDTEIITQNVYSVPAGYHYTGKTYQEFAEIMEQNARADFKSFMADIDIDLSKINNIYTLDKHDDVIETISQSARNMGSDAIMIGAKGRDATTALFIGSSAEKLIHQESDIPIFVIRHKGKSAGIMEYIKEL